MYFDNDGLLGPWDNYPHAYNSILYTMEYRTLLAEQRIITGNEPENMNIATVSANLGSVLDKISLGNGLFKNTPGDPVPPTQEELMSHDNMTAIAIASVDMLKDHHKLMWKEILRQGFRYNNLTPEAPGLRFVHPRDIIYIGILNNNIICRALFPLYALFMTISAFGADTSGKLLGYISCKLFPQSLAFRLLFKIMSFIISKGQFKGWVGVFAEYFKDPNHPNNVIARKVYGN